MKYMKYVNNGEAKIHDFLCYLGAIVDGICLFLQYFRVDLDYVSNLFANIMMI